MPPNEPADLEKFWGNLIETNRGLREARVRVEKERLDAWDRDNERKEKEDGERKEKEDRERKEREDRERKEKEEKDRENERERNQ